MRVHASVMDKTKGVFTDTSAVSGLPDNRFIQVAICLKPWICKSCFFFFFSSKFLKFNLKSLATNRNTK